MRFHGSMQDGELTNLARCDSAAGFNCCTGALDHTVAATSSHDRASARGGTIAPNSWLLAGPGQAVIVIRSADRLDDYAPGMKCGLVSGNMWRSSGEAADPEMAAIASQLGAAQAGR